MNIEYWEAVAIAGRVVGPCGIAIPLVHKDGQTLTPLGADGPKLLMQELKEVAEGGYVTMLQEPVIVKNDYRVGWIHPDLLGISEVFKRWNRLIYMDGSMCTHFLKDDDREVCLAAKEKIRSAFDDIETLVVKSYIDTCRYEYDSSKLLIRFEKPFSAALYTAEVGKDRRRQIIHHLGHLYRINGHRIRGLLQKMQRLYRIEGNDGQRAGSSEALLG